MRDIAEAPAGAVEKGRWYVIALCAVAMGLAFMDRNILPLFVHQIEADLRITDLQFSLLTGAAFALFYALCAVPIGWLVDTRSRPRIMGVGMLIWSAATVLTGFGRSFAAVFIARMLVGVGESSVSPASQSISTDLFLDKMLARAMSAVTVGAGIGVAGSLLFGGLITRLIGPSGTVSIPLLGALHAWQVAFVALGAPGLVIAPLLIFAVKDPKRRRVALKADGSAAAANYLGMLRFMWAHRATTAYVAFGYLFFFLASGALATWAPAHFIRHFHQSEATIGLTMGPLQLVGSTAALLISGWWIDRRLERGQADGAMQFARNTAALGLIPLLAFPLMPTFAGSLAMAVIASALITSGFSCSSISIMPLAPNQFRAQFGATFLIFINLIGGMAGPTLVALADKALFHDPNKIGLAAALVGGACLAVTATLLTLGARHYRASHEVVLSTTTR